MDKKKLRQAVVVEGKYDQNTLRQLVDTAVFAPTREPITKQDFFALGLSGKPDSAARRGALLKELDLPAHMSANALLQAVNTLFSREEFLARVSEL